MLVVGLTGGIATGKTAVVQMFAREGAWIVDLDALSRIVVEPHQPAWQEIIRAFGRKILRPDGTLNRSRLGHIVFADGQKRKELEEIVHPRALDEYQKTLRRIREKDGKAVVIADVPLLIEIGMQNRFDRIIVVYAPPKTQVVRLVHQRGLTVQAARARLKSQLSIQEKVRIADFVIDNSGSLEQTRAQVKEIYRTLKSVEEEKG